MEGAGAVYGIRVNMEEPRITNISGRRAKFQKGMQYIARILELDHSYR